MPLIESLSPRHAALLRVYQTKWRSLLLSTQPIEWRRAQGALHAGYDLFAPTATPEMELVSGPQALQERLNAQPASELYRQIGKPVPIFNPDFQHLYKRVQSQFTPELWQQIVTQMPGDIVMETCSQIWQLATEPLSHILGRAFSEAWAQGQERRRETWRQQPGGELLVQVTDWLQNSAVTVAHELQNSAATVAHELQTRLWQPLTEQPLMQPVQQRLDQWYAGIQTIAQVFALVGDMSPGLQLSLAMQMVSTLDFCSTLIDFSDAERQLLMTLRSLARSCGAIAPYTHQCWVIERPTQLRFDAEGRLHGEGEPAVVFADGSEFYAEHGQFQDVEFPPPPR